MAKNVAAFCPCPKTLPEAKLKSFGLMALAEEISRQSIHSVSWLLMATLIQIVKRNKLSKKKHKMYSLKEKEAPGNILELSLGFKEVESLKKILS